MTHYMKLAPDPFEMIKSGKKSIELRLYDEKRRRVVSGDCIIFTNTDTYENIIVTVSDVYRFNNFEELYNSLPLLQCGYTNENIAQAHFSDMERYYTIEEQNEYGVVGIAVKLNDSKKVCK